MFLQVFKVLAQFPRFLSGFSSSNCFWWFLYRFLSGVLQEVYIGFSRVFDGF